MSDVRVSSSSPSLEARQLEQHPKTTACRILFGSCDHQELQRELQRQGMEIEASFQQRWNFDPRQEKPLPGRLDWQAVSSEDIPDYYSRPCAKKRCNELDLNGNCARLAQDTAEDLLGNGAGRTDSPHQCNTTRKRPSGEDSSPTNKKNKTETDTAACGAVEQTPSKSNPRHQT